MIHFIPAHPRWNQCVTLLGTAGDHPDANPTAWCSQMSGHTGERWKMKICSLWTYLFREPVWIYVVNREPLHWISGLGGKRGKLGASQTDMYETLRAMLTWLFWFGTCEPGPTLCAILRLSQHALLARKWRNLMHASWPFSYQHRELGLFTSVHLTCYSALTLHIPYCHMQGGRVISHVGGFEQCNGSSLHQRARLFFLLTKWAPFSDSGSCFPQHGELAAAHPGFLNHFILDLVVFKWSPVGQQNVCVVRGGVPATCMWPRVWGQLHAAPSCTGTHSQAVAAPHRPVLPFLTGFCLWMD